MKIADTIARLLLGLLFVVFGINMFLQFIDVPPPVTEHGQAFMGAIYVTGFLTFVKVIEIAGGLLLLSGRFTGLGLLLLGPVIVNINLYHIFIEPGFNPVAVLTGVLGLFLLINRLKPLSVFLRS